MTRLLLDSTFLIDADRAGNAIEDAIGDDDDVAVAAITVAELRVGALLGTPRRRAARAAFVEDIATSLPVVVYDLEVAEAHAVLLAEVRTQGRPRGAHDLIIAASAKATGRTVVTADRTAFADLSGVRVRQH